MVPPRILSFQRKFALTNPQLVDILYTILLIKLVEDKSGKSKLASDWLLQTYIFQRVPENKQTLETWSSIIKDQTIYCFTHAAKNADPGIKHDRSQEVTGAHPQVNRGLWFTLAVGVSTPNDKTFRAVHGNSGIEYLYCGMEYVKCSTWPKYFFSFQKSFVQ